MNEKSIDWKIFRPRMNEFDVLTKEQKNIVPLCANTYIEMGEERYLRLVAVETNEKRGCADETFCG